MHAETQHLYCIESDLLLIWLVSLKKKLQWSIIQERQWNLHQ